MSSTTPSDECVISDEKEDFESVSGDSINSNVEEDKRSTVGVNDEVKGDGLADVTVEEMSGSSDTSITLHHNHTEKTRNKDINGDKTYRTGLMLFSFPNFQTCCGAINFATHVSFRFVINMQRKCRRCHHFG